VIKKLLLGLVIFVGAACGVEIFSNFVPHAGKFYVLEVCIEELGEMAGETFFIWAGYELLQSYVSHCVSPETSRRLARNRSRLFMCLTD